MLAPSPRQAMDEVLDAIAGWPKATTAIMGSSLGGFYATWLAERLGCKAVLLNPAVRPARDLLPHVGEHALWHDPSKHFVLERGFIDELKAMEIERITQPQRYCALIARGDEVLDAFEAIDHFAGADLRILPGGDHAISDYAEHLDSLLAFLDLV